MSALREAAMWFGSIAGGICLIGALVAAYRREPTRIEDSDYRDEI